MTPYGSARDLPSVKELEAQITAFRRLGPLLPKEVRQELKLLQGKHQHIVEIVDSFYSLLGERNWVFTDDFNLTSIEAVTNTESPLSAEERLISYYKTAQGITFQLGRLHRFKAMRPRIPLLQKALTDYNEGRYYSTVLVVLSVMDGFVNDVDTGSRRGLHARSEEDMVAWDSVTGHHLGLSHAHKTFTKGFYKTSTSEITDLFRNGIMHGNLVNFDNEVVATKAWNRLFAVADWADARERQTIAAEPTQSLGDAFKELKLSREQSSKIREWQSFTYDPSTAIQDPPAVFSTCLDFLKRWHAKQWAPVGAHFLEIGSSRSSVGKLAVNAKDLYLTLDLTAWVILRVRHTAPAVAFTDLELEVNGVTYRTDLRWVHVNETGMTTPESEPGRWFLSKYGPSHFLKPEKLVNDSTNASE